ncbi:MAG: T9SS type A sorting domain-containing protein [Bacteroidota bacterium]
MKPLLSLLTLLICFSSIYAQNSRDPFLWPFADSSIWNMPIGDQAVYVPALIEQAMSFGMTVDEDIIVLRPQENLQSVHTNYAGWDNTKDRCPIEGPILFAAPIPPAFIVSPSTWDGSTPNSGLAVLMPDGRTIKQTQPFSQCIAGQSTSQFVPPDVDLYGVGIGGAHGGSGLSAIGGTLRLGELDDANDTIRHALKVNLYAARNLYYDVTTEGYRWPAIRADSYAAGVYGTQRTQPLVTACRMGALLALPIWLDLDSMAFESVPGRILAEAFQKYGAYLVDDTAWDVYAIETEWSPDGRVIDEFAAAWGFAFSDPSKNTPWTRDMDRIFLNLHVVDNNGPNSIGGGGNPLMPLAPPFGNLTSTEELSQTEGQLLIAPNPTTGLLRLISSGPMAKLEIVNMLGQSFYQNSLKSEIFEIDVQSWPKGMYLLRVEIGGTERVERFVKQ